MPQMKFRTDKTVEELKTNEDLFLPLGYNNFILFEGDLYIESLINRKVYKLNEYFIGELEKVSKISDNTLFSVRGGDYFNSVFHLEIDIADIVFDGVGEINKVLNWFDKNM